MTNRHKLNALIEAHPKGVLSVFEKHGIYDIPTADSVMYWAGVKGRAFVNDLGVLVTRGVESSPNNEADGSQQGGSGKNFNEGVQSLTELLNSAGPLFQSASDTIMSLFGKKQSQQMPPDYYYQPQPDNSKLLFGGIAAIAVIALLIVVFRGKK